jgi:glucan phosphoethanolaminetransferase (alkaline phosphatase superfamily)
MNIHLEFILVSSFGVVVQEIIHWFDVRKKLDEEEQQKVLKSKYYWFITILAIIVFGIGTWIVFFPFEKKPSNSQALTDIISLRIVFLLGAAFPVIFKKLVALKQDLGNTSLERQGKLNFKDVLKVYLS